MQFSLALIPLSLNVIPISEMLNSTSKTTDYIVLRVNYDESGVPPDVLRLTAQIFDKLEPQLFVDGADTIDIIQRLLVLICTLDPKSLIEKLCVAVSHFLYHFDTLLASYIILISATKRLVCYRVYGFVFLLG